MRLDTKIKTNFRGIIDTTLREGEQFAFGDFSPAARKSIFKTLAEIDVDRIELGNPLVPGIKRDIVNLGRSFGSSRILAHVRNRVEDVRQALDLDIRGVNILCTVDQKRLKSMGISFSDCLNSLRKAISLVKNQNLESRVSVEDYWNQDQKRAMKIYRLADSLGVDRIGMADTLGVATPWEVAKDISQIRKKIKAEIEVHFHNDTGCAIANALAALTAGANWVDTTLLGIGERTGITPLSALLLRLYTINPRLVARYQLEMLTQADNQMAKILGVEVPFNLATNKKTGFSHKAGIHVNALMTNGPKKYEPVSPRVVGNQRRVITNSRISGRTTTDQIACFYKKFGRD